jgi:tetratricopeptide (TPR) repeat protein
MISLNSISPARIFSDFTQKARHPLTILFGVVVVGAIGRYVYCRLFPSLLEQARQALEKKDFATFKNLRLQAFDKKDGRTLHNLGQLALEKKAYKQATSCFDSELYVTPKTYALPYYWRNAADLMLGDYCRVKGGCGNAIANGNLDDQQKAQFYLQYGQAEMGQNKPSEAVKHFNVIIDLLQKESRSLLLAQAYYFKGMALAQLHKSKNEVGECCQKALAQLSDKEIEFRTEIFILRALFAEEGQAAYGTAETAHQSLYVQNANVKKEVWSALFFSLACVRREPQQYASAYTDFDRALKQIDNDPLWRAYILYKRGTFYMSAAKAFPDFRGENLEKAEKDFKAASECKSDDCPVRSQLLRCLMCPLFENLGPSESPIPRLAQLIAQDRSLI